MAIVRKNVFIADDDDDDRELFEDALTQVSNNDINLMKAGNGKELMDMLHTMVPPPPEIIFLDLNMPVKNGFECLAEIRATQKLKEIPVVIYSTSSEKEFIDKVYQQGADYYICKPTSFSKIKDVISHALSIDWRQHSHQPSPDKFRLA